MAKKTVRQFIIFECSICKNRNYTSQKNLSNTPDKLELKKFCQKCRKSTLHKETKK